MDEDNVMRATDSGNRKQNYHGCYSGVPDDEEWASKFFRQELVKLAR